MGPPIHPLRGPTFLLAHCLMSTPFRGSAPSPTHGLMSSSDTICNNPSPPLADIVLFGLSLKVFKMRLLGKGFYTLIGNVSFSSPTKVGSHITLLHTWKDTLKALKEKTKQSEAPEPEPEPTTEVLFLCSYEGCGKTFIDAGALRKHSHIHGERQYVCHYEGCGKKFLDSSKLKRHFLIHTGERDFVCPHEGCGKAFSLDFNLRSHMKTHSQENYHICPYPDCGKRFAHEYKLKNHITSHHEKNMTAEVVKYTPPTEKQTKVSKPSGGAYASASSDRPYACPYEGCEKAYIHEYKLKLHLRREHPGHLVEDNGNAHHNGENEIEGSDQDGYGGKRVNTKNQKQNKPKPKLKLPPSKISQRKGTTSSPAPISVKKSWPAKEETYEEEDSEETEEDRENVEEGWQYAENEDDDEETEYED